MLHKKKSYVSVRESRVIPRAQKLSVTSACLCWRVKFWSIRTAIAATSTDGNAP